MKTIQIQIPTKSDFIKWRDIFRFKINGGFECSHCGCTMFFNNVQLNGQDFLFENCTKGMCLNCTMVDIGKNTKKIFTDDHNCDWCGLDENKTASWIKNVDIDSTILFGKNWWNGAHICHPCLTAQLVHNIGHETSSIMAPNKNGKMRPVNSLGIIKQ